MQVGRSVLYEHDSGRILRLKAMPLASFTLTVEHGGIFPNELRFSRVSYTAGANKTYLRYHVLVGLGLTGLHSAEQYPTFKAALARAADLLLVQETAQRLTGTVR